WRRIEEIRIAVDGAGRIALAWRAKRALPASDIALLRTLCAGENVSCADAVALVYSVPSQNTAFRFSLDDFTQVNPAINDLLVARALAWLQPAKDQVIADFFCGLGNFSLPLAKCAHSVTGYELDAAMVERAQANAGDLPNLEFRAADLYAADAAIADIYAAALLDPPRAGAKALCEHLAKTKVLRRIVYVSCNPQTLIRDIDILARGGFRVERAALVDMFPQTGHIEAIVQLSRDPASS
ncbi:MAG TPA: methyltransferase domain-containing protein, partial [Spongiibacteraceae bacterium]|nr:methyltransferase domain-containing protein [Spongiibacteraceae bacterium]